MSASVVTPSTPGDALAPPGGPRCVVPSCGSLLPVLRRWVDRRPWLPGSPTRSAARLVLRWARPAPTPRRRHAHLDFRCGAPGLGAGVPPLPAPGANTIR